MYWDNDSIKGQNWSANLQSENTDIVNMLPNRSPQRYKIIKNILWSVFAVIKNSCDVVTLILWQS